jgi:hypothetical protein
MDPPLKLTKSVSKRLHNMKKGIDRQGREFTHFGEIMFPNKK